MRFWRLAFTLWMTAACAAAEKVPVVAIPTTEPGTTRPARDEIPAAALQDLYRTELGAAYDPVQADQLDGAHRLLEKYFEVRSSAERTGVVAQLQATQIDANILGRLCRVRSHWPALGGGGVFYIDQKSGPNDVRYFLGVPKTYDRGRAWPLVIRLPGAAAFLSIPPPDARRVAEIYNAWIHDELARHADAIVLMPLLNLEDSYGPSYAGMNSVILPMLDVGERVNVDPARVYMTGQSMAAQGVWNLALHCPTYFAAVNPMAGSAGSDWERLRLMNLHNTLPVVWHDDDDTVIKVGFSKSLVTELRQMKVEVDFEETQRIGHVPTETIVENQYRKLRARVRDLYPRTVWLQTNRPDIAFNRNDWVQIYQELDTGKGRNMFFHHGTGHMTVYPNSCSIKAQIGNNQIDASVDNVDTMRFYVNDQMVNMAGPVTVVVNKKMKFQGVVKPDIDQMLKDQVFLGRGWRYYSGVIDIGIAPPVTTRPSTRPTTGPAQKGKITIGSQPAGDSP